MEKKCLISKGHVNKYIFFAVIAGLSKCFVTLMVYIFQNYATYDKHPLIIGFNAGLGMSLSIIPLIIVKVKSHREIKIAKLNLNKTKSMKSRFIFLFFLFGTLLKLTISPPSIEAAFNSTYIKEQNMILRLNFIKEIFLCIIEQEENIASQRLIDLAKENNVNEEFKIQDIDKYAENVEDLNIIRLCKKSAYYNIGTNKTKKMKEKEEKSKRRMSLLIGGKRYKIYKTMKPNWPKKK